MVEKLLNIDRWKQLLSNQFLRNAGWLGLAELANRIFRLGTTVTLARMFSQEDYGLMAIVYTVFEFANVLTLRNGLGAKIIQADEADLEDICNTSYWINWILCISITLLQCGMAFPIAHLYGTPELVLPLCALSSMYLLFPFFMVQGALIDRENRLKIRAFCYAAQSLISNVVTITLALFGFGVWAIVLSLVLSTPIWILITWKNHPWRPRKSITFAKCKTVINYGRNMLGIDLLIRIKNNLDYLIVGKILGLDALGIYFFAFNAGSGITMNVVNALMSALFPHLCSVRDQIHLLKQEYFHSLKKVAKILIPLVLLQTLLAPFYVPIIFGSKWSEAIPVLMIICLSVIPRAYKWASATLINTVDKTHISLQLDLLYTLIFAVVLWIVTPYGILSVAVSVLILHILMSSFVNWISIRLVFAKIL